VRSFYQTVKRNAQLVWDRKVEGGFPESKELKQRIRDYIAPEKFLGHSDKEEGSTTREDCVECNEKDPVSTKTDEIVPEIMDAGAPKPNVGITYCTGCRWLLRAAWLAQELLTTFDTEIASVTLIPSRPVQKGGTFVSTSKRDSQQIS
jgi:predicted Rdx family selenoprotein